MKGCFGVNVNLSMYERLLRVVVGALLVSSVMFDKPFQLSGWTVYAAAAAGAVLVVTGVVGNCPVYAFLDRMVESAGAEKKKTRETVRKKARTAKKTTKSRKKTTKRRRK